MPAALALDSTCAICGEPLNGNATCLPCLLRGGLDETSEIAETPDLLVFGDFEIARREDGSSWELGHGAMGVTYLARDRVLERAVALKVIEMPTDAQSAQAARERFLREARSAAALRHPNVAGVFQFGAKATGNRCFYAMELVEGETLEAFVRREGPIQAELALEIITQVARAMIAAAAQGLIHRDLKPANIMLAPNEDSAIPPTVKVIDFGLAKSTAAAVGERDLSHGGFAGTPTFASPEQLGGAPVDARSDIYSFGVTFWYALTGELPCPGQTIEEIRKCQTQIPLPVEQLQARKVPAAMIQLLRQSLATDPGHRPSSARALLAALEVCREGVGKRPTKLPRFHQVAILAVLLGLTITALTGYLLDRSPAPLPSEKSIAILPFENLSKNESNAFFAAGIQDDVLTSLAKIHQLKVISRSSVIAYRDPNRRNMREIGKALGVATALEGSVRRVGDRVVINAQLVDTRTDRQLWANHYDRTATDAIGLEGELANEIATALQATLAPEERARLEARPTDNPEAYSLYLKGRAREGNLNLSVPDVLAAARLYGQAVALDPKFALAHARLSIMDSYLSHTPSGTASIRTTARAAAEVALRLAPALGEAHVARGLCLYWLDKDYDAALEEFSIAATTSPNEPNLFYFIAGIHRSQGRWREATVATQSAEERDPRNSDTFLRAGDNHLIIRDWAGAARCYERALKLAPDSADARISLAYIAVFRDGDPAIGKNILKEIPPKDDPDGITTQSRWDMAMMARDYAGAEKILRDSGTKVFPRTGQGAREFFKGRTARARGDFAAARRYFEAALPAFEAGVRDAPEDGLRHAKLGQLYAYMGRDDDAIRESRRAVELEPENQDALLGAKRSANLALTYALLGKSNDAIPLLQRLLSIPGPIDWPDSPQSITLSQLRLRWEWDSLRSDPRFQRILSQPEPVTALGDTAAK